MALLYSGLDATAAGEVVAALEGEDVPFEVADGAILVETSARDRIRMELAGRGLPAGGPAGYEILDYKLSQRSVVAPDPLQLDVYQLGFQAVSGQAAKRVSFYYLRTGQKETVEAAAPLAAQARVRALCRDLSREQAFQPQEGIWCAQCDFQEFCPAKARQPRALPAQNKLQQLGFNFDL